MFPLVKEWLRFLHPLSGKIAKVLVLELDNTLWGGAVGEDGWHELSWGLNSPEPPIRRFRGLCWISTDAESW